MKKTTVSKFPLPFTALLLAVVSCWAAVARSAERLVVDGPRALLDLAGTWEGVSTTVDLPWPAPASGWSAVTVPSDNCELIDIDVGRWAPPKPDKVIAADGRSPLASAKQGAWFRRTFVLPEGVPPGMRALLHCDGVAWRSSVRLNGQEVGRSILGVAPNSYDVTAVARSGSNVLAIGAACRASLWDAARKSYIAPTPAVNAGIWGGVRLELVPETRIDDVWVRTSVAKRRIEVELTLINAASTTRTANPAITIRGPDGQPVCALTAPAVILAAGTTNRVVLAADWLAPHLWTPATPVTYRAEATLREGAAVLDRSAVDFGYREFTASGRDFLLNGRRQVLLRNTWLTPPGAPRADVYTRLREETTHFNCLRMGIGYNNDFIAEQSDRIGMMVIPEFWMWYENSDTCWPIAQAPLWLPAAQETMARLVKRYRNHPSVIMWSLANEIMWDSTTPERMAVAEALCKTVRAADPTRLLQGDAEITWGGRLDVISIHYPEGSANETGTVRDRYPNASWIIPNDLDWLKQSGTNRSWRAAFVWDRPLSIGEYYCMDDFVLEGCTSYMGDEAFDFGKWHWQAWDGREAIMPRTDNSWLRMVKISSDRYRAAGVAALNPWTGSGRDIIPPLLARPLDLHPNAFGGEAATRRILVANDTGRAWSGMHLQVGLFAAGRLLWSEERLPAQVDPGAARELVVTLRPPAVGVITPATLIVRLRHDAGREARELARHEEACWIYPRASLADAAADAVALVDLPGAPTAAALAALGLAVAPGICDDAALAGKRLLIIGEGAWEVVDQPAAARFVASGGQLLILHQERLEPFVPGLPELDPKHAASMSWRHDAAHPALAGLGDAQLRWWRPDHLVATHSLVRPAAGPAAAAAASGGRFGMHWSPLATLRHGQGTITLCQYLLADRIDVEPAARLILAQAVRAALAARPAAPPPPLRLIGEVGKATRAVLADCSLATGDGFAGSGPLLLDAAAPPDAATLATLRNTVEAGASLWLRGLNAKTLPGVAALLPGSIGFAPLTGKELGAARRGDHPLLAGLGSGDFAWSRGDKITAPLGGPAILLPSTDAGEVLLEPALLVAVPLGRGTVLIDQLAWEAAQSAEAERVMRIVSSLGRNLGAGFRIAASKRYRFTALDLGAQVNRGYVDEIAGDGRGGWTDQGDNDLRYFLINHSGVVNGMAVPTQAFPAETAFNGVTFRLVDPKANGGKAILVLRGGPHDGAAPAEARGIPAGGAKADRIWFLHVGCWGIDPYFTTVARYEVVYADGTRAAIPVRLGREIGDWWTPLPLAGAQVAWSGRNEKHAPVGIYMMPWDNPSPEKAIATIDVVGSLAETQLVLLGITLGVEEGAERTAAAWDCGAYADGAVAGSGAAGSALKGDGTPVTLGPRALLRLAGGQRLSAELRAGPLAAGTPLALEIEVAPDAKPGGYYGGLIEAGSYQQAGLRLLLRHDLRVVVEHIAGAGPEKTTHLTSSEPLAIGQLSTVRYEHDGRQARLLINGRPQQTFVCPPPAAWRGTLTVGAAGGPDFFLNGAVGAVRLLSLAPGDGTP